MTRLTTIVLSLLLAAHSAVADDLPDVDENGLHRVKSSELRVVYAKPGATLAGYNRVAILECFVAFREGWQKDYNATVRGSGRRVSDKDVERIKRDVAEKFRKVFVEELETEGGYEVVDVAADDVLLLRPAIINLDVSSPDTRGPGRYNTIVSSAGSMTLYLELYDAASDEMIAKVIDPRAAPNYGGASMGNSVNNKAEADRILRRWADILRDHLDEARAAQ